ncbi:MAG: hypothetical protein ACHQJ7_08820, partial [Vicinamibacteria bacterium]
MDAYLNALVAPELPLPWWLALTLWVVLYALTHIATARSRAALRMQSHVVIDRPDVLEREQRPASMALAFVLLTAFLLAGYPMGEPYTSLVVGGLLGTIAMLFGIALHSLQFAASLAKGGDVQGTITLSPAFVLTNVGHDMLGCAAACLALGIALA